MKTSLVGINRVQTEILVKAIIRLAYLSLQSLISSLTDA